MMACARYAAVAIATALLWWLIGAFFSLEANPLHWKDSARLMYVFGVFVLLVIYWVLEGIWKQR